MQTVGHVKDKVKTQFPDMVVYKDPSKNKFFSSLGIPSYLRDWLLKRFSDEEGRINIDEVQSYVRKVIPRKEEWEAIKAEMVHSGKSVRILAKIRVEIDIKTGEGLFRLPDFGFPSRRYEAIINRKVLDEQKEALLTSPETWGVVELEWQWKRIEGRPGQGVVSMQDFRPFRPYKVDLDFYQGIRTEFELDEWMDVLLMAVDYNPAGFINQKQKVTLLSRLLPFLEKRLNVVELAPKGTGKSYLFSQISKYGWLVSGGSVTRARLFYDISQKTIGILGRHDFVALDEIQSISFPDENEMRGALKGYLESGEFRVGDYRGIAEAGIVLLGNINEHLMDVDRNMFQELPNAFQESALLDRFHGFIKGWDIPRMREDMKACGWAINSEYFSEITHALRNDIRYRALVDDVLTVPKGADTRDTEAIKRLTTAFLKLLFPHAVIGNGITKEEIMESCLKPAVQMRSTIRRQLHIMDKEYSLDLPEVAVEGIKGQKENLCPPDHL